MLRVVQDRYVYLETVTSRYQIKYLVEYRIFSLRQEWQVIRDESAYQKSSLRINIQQGRRDAPCAGSLPDPRLGKAIGAG